MKSLELQFQKTQQSREPFVDQSNNFDYCLFEGNLRLKKQETLKWRQYEFISLLKNYLENIKVVLLAIRDNLSSTSVIAGKKAVRKILELLLGHNIIKFETHFENQMKDLF